MLSSFFIALAIFVTADDGEPYLRFGGTAAVPGKDDGPEAPVEVAPRPFQADAVYRTHSGGWRFYDGAKDRVVVLPIVGDRLVGWSANGGSILTSLASGRLVRWNAVTWEPVAELVLPAAPEHAAISPDGHHILVATKNPDGERRFMVFGGAVGMKLAQSDRPGAQTGAIALADERAAVMVGEHLEILTIPSLEPERVIALDEDIRALAFAHDGREVLALRADKPLVMRFDAGSGAPLPSVSLPEGCARGALAANGRVAACMIDRPTRAVIVDLGSGETRSTVPAPMGVDPVIDPIGSRIAFPGNRAVPVWDATVDGVLPAAARAGAVKDLALAADGRVMALEGSGVARVWDPATGTETFRVQRPAAAIATSADGAILFVGGSPLTALVEATGETLWTVKGSRPVAVATVPGDPRVLWIERGGELKVRTADGRVRRFARANGRPTIGNVPRLSVSPDGKRVLFGTRVLDLANGKVLYDVPAGLAAWAGARVVVATGSKVATVGEGSLTELAGAGVVTALSSDAGLVVAGDRDGAVHVWTADGRSVIVRSMHRGPVAAVVLDVARQRVYSAGSDGVILGLSWGAATGTPTRP